MLNPYLEQSHLLVQLGQFEEALQCLEMFLKERPDQVAVWNEAGVLCVRLGQQKRAIKFFLRGLDLPDPPPQIYENLINSYISSRRLEPAVYWLRKGLDQGHISQTTVSRLAQCFEQNYDYAGAMDSLQNGKQKLDCIHKFQNQIESLKDHRAKIAFFCGADGPAFLKDIVKYASERYPVRYFEGQTQEDVYELMKWSDISWFEWSTELARIASHLPKVCRTIVRLHRYEAHLNWPKLINWQNVDLLMTVGNDWVIKAINHWVGDIHRQTRVVTIPNGVDLGAINYKPRRPGKKIAFVAKLRMVKNPILLVQCMADLLKMDPDFKLYMAGERHDLLLRHYLEHITDELGIKEAFIYDEWQDDVQAWLEDKSFIVSTSVIESQGMGLLEAMAAGIKPVIHHFPGAEGTFGKDYLFKTPQEFSQQILKSSYHSEQYRQFVEQNYPLSQQLLKINEIFVDFERTPLNSLKTPQQDGLISGTPDAFALSV